MKKWEKQEIRHILGIKPISVRKQFSHCEEPTVRAGLVARMIPQDRLSFIKQTLNYASQAGVDNPLQLLDNTSEDLFAKVFAATFQEDLEGIGIADEPELKAALLKIAKFIIEQENRRQDEKDK